MLDPAVAGEHVLGAHADDVLRDVQRQTGRGEESVDVEAWAGVGFGLEAVEDVQEEGVDAGGVLWGEGRGPFVEEVHVVADGEVDCQVVTAVADDEGAGEREVVWHFVFLRPWSRGLWGRWYGIGV